MPYIITLILMLAAYVTVIFLMKYMRNTKLTNGVFVGVIFGLYLLLSLTVYLDVGFYDWNFQNTLPIANVSPLMFSTVPLVLILPKKYKPHYMLLISLLSVGMFLSGALGCLYYAIIHYKFHLHFVYDFVAHLAMSLLGVYFIKSKQVQLNVRNALISSSLIFGAAITMLIVNLIFDTTFFGLSLYGKHTIYNTVLVEESWLSAVIYFVGLSSVLLLGYVYSHLVAHKPQNLSAQQK